MVKRLALELPNRSTVELREVRPSPALPEMPPSPSDTPLLLLINTPRPPLKLRPSIETLEEFWRLSERWIASVAVTVAVPGLALMDRFVKPKISTFSVVLQVTKMLLGPEGVMDAKAAEIVTKVPGFTPAQSTVTLLAWVSAGANSNNRLQRTTLNEEVANFILFSLLICR